MTFEQADRLLREILIFLNRQGGSYRQITNVGKIQETILTALATGRFFYDQTSFVCWSFTGEHLHIEHAAGDLAVIRRVVRKLIKQGLSWERPARNRVINKPRKRS